MERPHRITPLKTLRPPVPALLRSLILHLYNRMNHSVHSVQSSRGSRRSHFIFHSHACQRVQHLLRMISPSPKQKRCDRRRRPSHGIHVAGVVFVLHSRTRGRCTDGAGRDSVPAVPNACWPSAKGRGAGTILNEKIPAQAPFINSVRNQRTRKRQQQAGTWKRTSRTASTLDSTVAADRAQRGAVHGFAHDAGSKGGSGGDEETHAGNLTPAQKWCATLLVPDRPQPPIRFVRRSSAIVGDRRRSWAILGAPDSPYQVLHDGTKIFQFFPHHSEPHRRLPGDDRLPPAVDCPELVACVCHSAGPRTVPK
jgi:hypothetical protein